MKIVHALKQKQNAYNWHKKASNVHILNNYHMQRICNLKKIGVPIAMS